MIKLIVAVFMVLLLTNCISQGSKYEYLEKTDTYTVSAYAEINNNSDSVDLEILVLQNGNVVKHIKFGKEGTDNSPAIEAQADVVEDLVGGAVEALDGFTSPILGL